MARKVVVIQESIETNDEFEAYLRNNYDKLICLEVYSEFCGYCLAASFAIRKGKLEIGEDRIMMARAPAEQIDVLSRFRGKSEPVFLFISKGKLTRGMFGSNGIELCRIMTEELDLMQKEIDTGVPRPKQNIDELLPEEAERVKEELKLEKDIWEGKEKLRVITLAARKKRVAERLSKHLPVQQLNFILFWPHNHQAHYDLYEKWDPLDIQVVAKETMQLTEEGIKEALYMSDVEPNEACVYALMNGEAMVVLFRMFERDERHFQEEREERERLAAEQARLAREAEEDRLRIEKQRQEEERMARIQAGLPAEPEPEQAVEGEETAEGEVTEGEGKDAEDAVEAVTATEEVVAELEAVEPEQPGAIEEDEDADFNSQIAIEGEEYIPPGGLFVPGLYSPPNDLAKANALTFFFPKVIAEVTPIESEYLPLHSLMMFSVDKRHEVQEIMQQFPEDILNYGIFEGDDPATAEHLAFTIKQYDQMQRDKKNKDRLAIMVSRKTSLPMLQLGGLNPCYISHDEVVGERDCLYLFPVGYGDEYAEEESIKEVEGALGEPDVVNDEE